MSMKQLSQCLKNHCSKYGLQCIKQQATKKLVFNNSNMNTNGLIYNNNLKQENTYEPHQQTTTT